MMTIDEAVAVVGYVDVAWPDIPLRPETMAIWIERLSQPKEYITHADAMEGAQFLLDTEPRRPAIADLLREARSQYKIRLDRQHSPVQFELPE